MLLYGLSIICNSSFNDIDAHRTIASLPTSYIPIVTLSSSRAIQPAAVQSKIVSLKMRSTCPSASTHTNSVRMVSIRDQSLPLEWGGQWGQPQGQSASAQPMDTAAKATRGLRQKCKKRARSPFPSASPTDSDLQPLPKVKRRPTPHEKDEAPAVFGGVGEEVLWGPLNKAREGEIVKAAETAYDQTGLTMGKRAPRGQGRKDGGDDDKMDIDEGAGAAGGDDTLESLAEWLGEGRT
ncbi:unnamed protein product [Vitrella brassicaformis CCMP3155]|uniref:Uncharacterized protein n=1 Tax=Vitrella brassicaformis (strain CCMP3155) TaxID=1169540 RepID=A0A0G4GNJ2_VITBC|nr:unnamed protein product [Vitrella brassicaformis CCMP3155]|eukprot:CEM31856.1 unnamed protein product [Vitrella brassicaformis CCMP3155]